MLDLPFLPFCVLLGGLGFVCVIFVSAWCQHWRGGFALDGSAQMFNWHPVLMVTGMVVLYGAAAVVYRLPPAWSGPKLPWKVLHSTLALAAFGLAVLGLAAVFRFHRRVQGCVGLGEGWAHPGKLSALFLPRKNGTTEYKRLPAEAVFANMLGLLILLFGVLVLGTLARPSWKRPDADSPDSCQ
ncbi:CYAC3 protein, partial [Hydrobates tethys]|nr:CYAC3 protein [Oceanodroma tethys]